MARGYIGQLAKVNLSTREVIIEPLNEQLLHKYVGGSGLGAKILFDETGTDTDPLGEDNLLMFLTGPLTGTRVISSDRFEVITKSPLTGIYLESNCGGHWAEQLKRSGFDGLILYGKAEAPCYLVVRDGEVELRDAKDLWGLDTFITTNRIQDELGKSAQVVCIGPAGEQLVKFATIMTDGVHARAAGRGGAGAVMGSKKLKAIAVLGGGEIPIADKSGLAALMKEITPSIVRNLKILHDFGTSNAVENLERCGDLPIKNWYQGNWKEGAAKISGQMIAQTIQTGYYHCGRCPIGCGRIVQVKDGPYRQDFPQAGPEYETIGMLGSNCLIDDLAGIAKATEWCNRYGMDTCTTGSLVGFAMEAYERGFISSADLGGVELRWGSVDALIAVIHQIARREYLGDLLAEGIVKTVEELGGTAAEFAVHVKGLDFPAHDPRAKVSSALGYVTSNRGACHLQAFTHDFEEGTFDPSPVVPDLGYPDPLDRFTPEGKAEFVAKFQHLMSMYDSLVTCKLPLFGGFSVIPLVKSFNLVTGWDWDQGQFLETGERIFNLKRMYNVQLGISRKDDTLPPRILTHRRGGGTNELPKINDMLSDYYQYRGWDEFGIPTEETLCRLGLEQTTIRGRTKGD